jgi:hypothetical protein
MYIWCLIYVSLISDTFHQGYASKKKTRHPRKKEKKTATVLLHPRMLGVLHWTAGTPTTMIQQNTTNNHFHSCHLLVYDLRAGSKCGTYAFDHAKPCAQSAKLPYMTRNPNRQTRLKNLRVIAKRLKFILITLDSGQLRLENHKTKLLQKVLHCVQVFETDVQTQLRSLQKYCWRTFDQNVM